MDALVIKGPAKLKGRVLINGSKNCALPLLFASLLFDEEVCFSNVPRLWDIETTLHLLSYMGVEYQWDKEEGKVQLLPRIKQKVAPYEWVSRMRAGILALGPLVGKYGEAKVSLPGGCAIGARPVNFHLEALRKMGVRVEVDAGYIKASVRDCLRGADIEFPKVTVTGTANLLIAATCAEGRTTLRNAAREPEVVALGEWLQQLGANIRGLGSSVIEIRGGALRPPKEVVQIPPDRIETGTWIGAAAVTQSELSIHGTDARKLTAVLSCFRDMGVGIEVEDNNTTIRVYPTDSLLPLRIETSPYPGFPTDMQAQLLTCMCFAQGKSEVRETIFENRFMHVAELRRLGAKIEIEENTAKAYGPNHLVAAPIMATDLRASASLVIAALRAEGTTKISRIYHLDRGYQKLDRKLQALGVHVERIVD